MPAGAGAAEPPCRARGVLIHILWPCGKVKYATVLMEKDSMGARTRWRRQRSVPPEPQPGNPSLSLLLQLIMLERDKQLAHFDALDTKAGVLIAFDGVLITLSQGIRWPFQVAGISLAAVSALLALGAFWPRKYPVLHPPELRKYLTYRPEQTQLILHDTIGDMVRQGGRVLEDKARKLKRALLLLLLAILAFGAAIILAAYPGKAHHGIQRPVPSSAPSAARSGTASAAPTPSTGG